VRHFRPLARLLTVTAGEANQGKSVEALIQINRRIAADLAKLPELVRK
jgi:hypothetical protein